MQSLTPGGRRTPSVYGSQKSVYSTGSTLRTLTKSGPGKKSKSMQSLPWYRKPLVRTAFYTDLQRGSWHFGFYSFVSSIIKKTSSNWAHFAENRTLMNIIIDFFYLVCRNLDNVNVRLRYILFTRSDAGKWAYRILYHRIWFRLRWKWRW